MKQPYRLPPELPPDPPRGEADMGELVSEHRAKISIGPGEGLALTPAVMKYTPPSTPRATATVATSAAISKNDRFVIAPLTAWAASSRGSSSDP